MTFLTKEQQNMFKNKINEDFAQKLLQLKERVDAEFHFQSENSISEEEIKKILGKLSPPYVPTPKGCGLVEDKLCDNTNK